MSLASYAQRRLADAGLEAAFPRTDNIKEFAVRTGRNAVTQFCRPRAWRASGYRLGRDYQGSTTHCSWLSRSAARLRTSTARGSAGALKLIFEKSQSGRRGGELPRYDVPPAKVPEELRRAMRRDCPSSPSRDVRHFTELSTRNFGIDTGFYPLGSCTMKYKPARQRAPGHAARFQRPSSVSGRGCDPGRARADVAAQEALIELSGLHACSLQPAAGSQGELTGLMLMRAYSPTAAKPISATRFITADTAHGTNPASVTMAGYKLAKVETDARGTSTSAPTRDGE